MRYTQGWWGWGGGFLGQAIQLKRGEMPPTPQEMHLSVRVCQTSKMTPREGRGLAQEHAACKNQKGCSQRVQGTMGSQLRSEGSPGEGPRPLGPHSPQRFCLLHPCQASRARTPPADTHSASWRPHAWLVGRQATLQAGGTLAPTPEGPGGMWPYRTALLPFPALHPSAPRGEGPSLCPRKPTGPAGSAPYL